MKEKECQVMRKKKFFKWKEKKKIFLNGKIKKKKTVDFYFFIFFKYLIKIPSLLNCPPKYSFN